MGRLSAREHDCRALRGKGRCSITTTRVARKHAFTDRLAKYSREFVKIRVSLTLAQTSSFSVYFNFRQGSEHYSSDSDELNSHIFITRRAFHLRILLTAEINFLCRVVVHYALNFKRAALIIFTVLKIIYGATDYLFITFSKRAEPRVHDFSEN